MADKSTSDGGSLYRTKVTTAVDNISFSCWFKLTSLGREHYLFENGVTGGFGEGWGLLVGSDNKLHIDIAYVADIAGATTLVAGTWYHVAVIRNSGTWTIYLNGVSDGTGTNSPFSIGVSDKTVIQGYNQDNSSIVNDADSEMAEVGFWSRVITGTELTNLASCNSKPGDLPTSLLVYLSLVDSATFTTNGGSGGDFTKQGTLTQTTHPAQCVAPSVIHALLTLGAGL